MLVCGSDGVFGVCNGYGKRHCNGFARAVSVLIRARFLFRKRKNAVAVGKFMGKVLIVFYQFFDNPFDL